MTRMRSARRRLFADHVIANERGDGYDAGAARHNMIVAILETEQPKRVDAMKRRDEGNAGGSRGPIGAPAGRAAAGMDEIDPLAPDQFGDAAWRCGVWPMRIFVSRQQL